MHIPDGLLDAKTWIGAGAISAGGLTYAVRKIQTDFNERQIPTMGVLAAFIFAAQMVNFPIIGGTSGHLGGGALAAILLGPWAGGIIMSTVLIIQAFIFFDGGITALGANILNMAVIAPLIGYYVYSFIFKKAGSKRAPASFLAAWASVMFAAAAAALEIAFSGTAPLYFVLPAMLGWHFLIGIGEGVITAVVIGYLTSIRSDLVYNQQLRGEGSVS